MNVVIELDVPEWQIGQDVTIYFPDTMQKHGKCKLPEKVKPQIFDYPSGRRRAWCGSCGHRLRIGYKGDCSDLFCGHCGKEVLWND